MQRFPNLVLDSILANKTLEFLQRKHGAATISEIVRRVFQLSTLDETTSAALVADALNFDDRFDLSESGMVKLTPQDYHALKLADTDFVVFDTETTGSKPPAARMTEIGLFKVRGNEIVDKFETLLNSTATIPPNIVELTGITNEMKARAPKFAEIAPALLDFIGDAVLVAHNANFDITFLNFELGRVFPKRKIKNHHLCTVRLSRKLLPNIENHRLHTIAAHYGITIHNRHRAAGDALATAQIFVHFLAQLQTNGVETIGDIRKLKSEMRAR